MTSREQTLALVLLGAILVIVGGAGGYFFIYQPLQKQRMAEATLNKEIDDLEAEVRAQANVAKNLTIARKRSLPADEAMARREYTVALERLAESAGVPKGYTISPKTVDNSVRSVPEISKGKPVYTRMAYQLVFKKADMWMIKDFLEGYYRLGLLHQITALDIKKDDDPGAKNAGRRNGLTVTITTEAIIVDGADKRHTLLAIPTAFAGIGGGAAYKALAITPEAARGVVPDLPFPILSPVHRDYSLIVQKDPFNGPLPPPPPFKLAKISDVKVKTDERSSPVKVALSGEGATGAKVIALVAEKSTLFAPGELKVDPKTYAIELPKTSATEGKAEIKVIATSAEGVRLDTSFKVSVEAKKEEVVKVEPKEDISPFVVLVGIAQRSDGSAWVRILDKANRMRYQIDVERTGIKIAKEEIVIPRKGWTPVDDHKYPPGVMVISHPNSQTHRTFKVIAVDHDELILADLKPGGAGPPAPPARPGPGRFPGMGGPRPGFWPPRQGHGDPLAALGGNMIIAPPKPKYYRWQVGQSLSGIKQIPDSKAQEILKDAEASGPVLNVATANP